MTAEDACKISAKLHFQDDIVHQNIRARIDVHARAAAMNGDYDVNVVVCEKHNPKIIVDSLVKDGFRVKHVSDNLNGKDMIVERYQIEW